jgi:glycyl-tRNA synthetase beta chain
MAKNNNAKASRPASLLVELLTEELPPNSLRKLADAFGELLVAEIIRHRLKDRDPKKRVFATPRRLGVLIADVANKGTDSEHEVTGPLSSNTKAVEGFARKHRLAPESLERQQSEKGEIVVARFTMPGVQLDAVLAELVQKAITKLPVAKLMRWGSGEAQFVRPVHGLVMMHGNRMVPGTVLEVKSANRTRGHRFMGKSEILLKSAEEYEARLREEGKVIADFGVRRDEIRKQLRTSANKLEAQLGEYESLLDEVTALVEHPSVYVGEFDAAYLDVPHECLTLAMRQHQRYFPLFDDAGRLLPKFLIVSNMKPADPRNVIHGNERVVRPRMEDARFFYNRDRKIRLEARVPELAKVVYHSKLGSQRDRVDRLKLLSGEIARKLGADRALAERAAELCKADLLTGMVGEFPELQGVMGRYYALHDGEPREVAEAIEAHYRPRFAGDDLPRAPVSCAVALADKLEALAGLFGVGQQPTGDKDPYGLRRAALGILRILAERDLSLHLHELVSAAFEVHRGRAADARAELESFIYERLAGYLRERGYTVLEAESVVSLRPVRINLVPRQMEAVRAFNALPEAESLAAANKRVVNILRQAGAKGESFADAKADFLKEPAERALFEALRTASQRASLLFEQGDFAGYLKTFAVLKSPVDAFFDSVMVMAKEPELRHNRLALLADLRQQMNRVADISKLAAA